MDNVSLVQVVDRLQNLFDSLRCIFLRESALFAYPVEKLASSRQLGDYVVFVLKRSRV